MASRPALQGLGSAAGQVILVYVDIGAHLSHLVSPCTLHLAFPAACFSVCADIHGASPAQP